MYEPPVRLYPRYFYQKLDHPKNLIFELKEKNKVFSADVILLATIAWPKLF